MPTMSGQLQVSALAGVIIRGETLPWHVAQPSHLHAWGYAIHQSCWSGGLVPDSVWAHVQVIVFSIWVWGIACKRACRVEEAAPRKGRSGSAAVCLEVSGSRCNGGRCLRAATVQTANARRGRSIPFRV